MKVLDSYIKFQKKFSLWIVLLGLVLTIALAPRAIKLLTNIATNLINLLPASSINVKLNDQIKAKFPNRSNLYLVIYSDDPKANLEATLAVRDYLESLPEVDSTMLERPGYDFFDKYKFLFAGLDDLYQARDKLKEKIQQKKLGGMYIDFEEEDNQDTLEGELKSYKERFSGRVIKSRYYSNPDETIFALSIYPQNRDQGLAYFKEFGQFIEKKILDFDLKRFGKTISWGYAGEIKTRVDEYNALMNDLKTAGLISAIAIFIILLLYFRNLIPVIVIFIPVTFSTIYNFAFCSLFFEHLNVVTSFLFTIILGLGVDIGIHMMTRYLQDKKRGEDIDQIYVNVIKKTGKSCALGILTTVATFYILTTTDFKGFSEFGWIAGNGLLIALISYLIFIPAMMAVIERFGLISYKNKKSDPKITKPRRTQIPYAKILLLLLILINVGAFLGTKGLQFEWNFNKLKMTIPEREKMRDMIKETRGGRVNSPAVFLVENEVQAKRIRSIVEERKKNDKNYPTIDYIRSYYDLVPRDQKEKMHVIKDIDNLLSDQVINQLSKEDLKLVRDIQHDIKNTEYVSKDDIPQVISDAFTGTRGDKTITLMFAYPLPELHLSNGYNAMAFYEDVHKVDAFGKNFYSVSNGMIFAEVLITMFKDSKLAISLAFLVLLVIITVDFRNGKQVLFIFLGLGSGILMMLGLMTLFHLKINFYNMIIIPAVMGMGIDNSIHLAHRFDEFKRKSILSALRTSGGASFMASITTMLGYSGLCFAHHPGLNSIGNMAVIGMGSTLIGSLVILPILLQIFLKPKK